MERVLRSVLAIATLALLAPAAAHAETPFGLTCTADATNDNVRICPGATATRVLSFDNTPLDVNVVLPATGDTNLPLITIMHGYGGNKQEPTATGGDAAQLGSMVSYAKRGYAVLSFAARGFKESCGSASSRTQALTLGQAAFLACQKGWIHLDDMRFEARDAQTLMGKLVDQGIVDPQRLGVAGVSYGGITSTQLAALKDRMWVFPAGGDPNTARLEPFTSPTGVPMTIAAAGPSIPGSDLAYSLVPNGRTTDFQVIDRKDDIDPVGVPKLSYVSGFYGTGNTTGGGYYAPAGVDQDADITTWYGRITTGDPFDEPVAQGIVEKISRWHSGIALLSADTPAPVAPAPTLFGNGFTDDLFPVDEALRFANAAHALFPATPVSMFFADYGHARGQNKADDLARLRDAYAAWFDHYVMGTGPMPFQGVTALTQTCPKATASGGPFSAGTWEAMHPGEVRKTFAPPVSVASTGGNPDVARTVDPIAGGGACATTSATDQPAPAAATYRMDKVTDSGYTLMGAPTVIATIAKDDAGNAQIAARLWDVAADGATQTLVARTLYRPVADGKPEVFQLHANGYEFAAGHTPKLELLGADAPYGRAPSGAFSLSISNLELRLPVRDAPDCVQVMSHAPVFAGSKALAPGIDADGTPPCGEVKAAAPSPTVVATPSVTATTSGTPAGTQPQQPATPITPVAARTRPAAVRHTLRCRSTGSKTATCRDRGRVMTDPANCASGGTVRVRFTGRTTVKRRVPLRGNCRYTARGTVRTKRRKVTSAVRFAGNAALTSRSAKAKRAPARGR